MLERALRAVRRDGVVRRLAQAGGRAGDRGLHRRAICPAAPTARGSRPRLRRIGPAIELADLDRAAGRCRGRARRRHLPAPRRCSGRAIDAQRRRLDGLTGRITPRGAGGPDPTELEAKTGKLIEIVRHVADVAAAIGERLRAGEVIITGSVIAPMFLEPGETAHRRTCSIRVGEVSVGF